LINGLKFLISSPTQNTNTIKQNKYQNQTWLVTTTIIHYIKKLI